MSVIRLSRAYVCVAGAPVLHAVDAAIFSLKYFTRCMACGFCKDQCCSHGVDIDVENARRLLALGPEFRTRVRVPAEQWFTPGVTQDPEFPSGAQVRTQVADGKCVFADISGRGCVIHAWCNEKDIDYHTLKPIVSTLFPVTFEKGVLVPSSEMLDGSLVCGGDGASLYDGVRGELAHYFGSEFVAELDGLRASL